MRGYYRWLNVQTLVREVTVPYHEVTTLRDGKVFLERDGQKRRDFDLSHVPELTGLYTGFSALLSGNRALLERIFVFVPRVHRMVGSCIWHLWMQHWRNRSMRCVCMDAVPI